MYMYMYMYIIYGYRHALYYTAVTVTPYTIIITCSNLMLFTFIECYIILECSVLIALVHPSTEFE